MTASLAVPVNSFADDKQEHDALWSRAVWCDLHISDESAISILDSMLVPSKKFPDIIEAVHILRATYYYQRRDIDGLSKAFNEARVWGNAHNNDYCVFLTWERVVLCYYYLERYDEFLAEIRLMQNEARRQNSAYGIVQGLVQEGNYHTTYKDYQSAYKCYSEAVDVARKNIDKPHINIVYACTMLGNAYFQLKEYDKSAQALTEAIGATNQLNRQMAPRSYLYRTQVAAGKLAEATASREWFLNNAPRERLLTGMRDVFDATEVEYFLLAGDTKTAHEKLQLISDDYLRMQHTHKVLAREGKWEASYDTLMCYRTIADSLFKRLLNQRLQAYHKDNSAQELSMKNAAIAQQNSKLRFRRAAMENERARLQAQQDEMNILEIQRQASEAEWRELQQDSLLKEVQQHNLIRREKENAQDRASVWHKVAIALFLLIAIFTFAVILYNALRLNLERRKVRLTTARAKQTDKMKSVFMQNLNHEIRAPLASIVSFSDLLSSKDLNASEEERALMQKQLHTNTELLLTLLDDVIDLSALQSGNYQITLEPFQLSSLCQTAVASMAPRVPEGVEIRADLPDDEVIITSDHSRVYQVIGNLLSNACKYTEQGSITLAYRKVDANFVEISVTDTGCGIPASKADAVFRRYETLGTLKKGFGLGLFICRSVVELLGGKIWVDTSYTQGARFCFRLPISAPNKSARKGHLFRNAVVALMAGIFSLVPLDAQAQNNPAEIHDDIYPYYLSAASMVRLGKGMDLVDTLEQMSIRYSDLKAQCLARVLRLQYHSSLGMSVDSLLILSDDLISFCRHTPYKQYCFSGLNVARVRALNANDLGRAREIVEQYQRLAIELNIPYGLANVNVALGDYYTQLLLHDQALPYYRLAFDKFLEFGEEKNAFTPCMRVASTLRYLHRYDEALQVCHEAEQYCLVPSNFKQLLLEKLIIFTNLQAVDSIQAVIRTIDNQYRSTLSSLEASKYFKGLVVCALSAGDYDRALSYADSIYSPENRRSALMHIYMERGDYQQLYDMRLSLSSEQDSINGMRLVSISQNFIKHYAVQQQQLLLEQLEIEQRDIQTQSSLEETRMLRLQHQRDSALKANNEQLVRDHLMREELSRKRREGIHQEMAEKDALADANRRRNKFQWITASFVCGALFLISALLFVFSRRMKKTRGALLQAWHEAEEADRLKSRFLQDLNHEIRTPLNAILGFTDILRQTADFGISEQEQAEMNHAVHTQSSHLFHLVNQVLDLSKLESGTYQFQKDSISLPELCREALDSVRPQVQADVDLRLELPSELPAIRSDKARLLQLLGHLLRNAASATSSGHITLFCQVIPQAGEQKLLEFRVQDTGHGIPAEELSRVFRRFYKSDQFAPGFGLGLPICQTIVQLMGGTIEIQSSAEGTTVTAQVQVH